MSDPNNLRLSECAKYFDGKFVNPSDNEVQNDSFDVVFDTVGLEVSRQQAISVIKPGGTIIHIGLTQPAMNKMPKPGTVTSLHCVKHLNFRCNRSFVDC